MADILSFAGDHPFLAWCLAWSIWPVYYVAIAPFGLIKRYLRSRDIQRHGWPKNPLMDADGDIVRPEKED
jgi:hypothetical protein